MNDHEYQWVIDMLKGDIVENGFSTDSSGKIKLINMITFWLVLGGWKRVKSMQEQVRVIIILMRNMWSVSFFACLFRA